jgi:hypothetical protein
VLDTVIQPANQGTGVALALRLQVIAPQGEDAVVSFFPSGRYFRSCFSVARRALVSPERLWNLLRR